MNITIEPTREMFDAPINGVTVPVRIWAGHTDTGIRVEAYVLAITPGEASEHGRLRAQLPDFMRPSAETFTIDLERP